MRFSLQRALIIARREFMVTIKRRAFLFTIVAIPAYFAFIMTFSASIGQKEVRRTLSKSLTLGVVDSTGLLGGAPTRLEFEMPVESNFMQRPKPGATPPAPRRMSADVVRFESQAAGEQALLADQVQQLLVLPPDYLEKGGARLFKREQSLIGGSAVNRLIQRWMTGALLAGRVDSQVVERAARPNRGMTDFSYDEDEKRFVLQDDAREMVSIMLPLALAMLLSTAIVTGGQYLLQGVTEEKETRILESLLCTVSTNDLMVGKMLGLGGAGLLMVTVWTAVGAFFGSPLLLLAEVSLSPTLVILAITYFLLGYLFYASIMTGIGAVTNNMREAQQFAFMFTFANFVPFITMWATLSQPNGPLAVGLSMFPMTAPSQMMMRLATGATVPAWQIALSLALLAGAAWLAIAISSRVFRIGLLMYGKTPNLPEILRWATSRH